MTDPLDLRTIGPDDGPPPAMMCDVCKGVLTPFSLWSPLTGEAEHGWRHPGGRTYGHDPVPVPTDMAVATQVCDFCTANEVTGYALATPFETTYRGMATRDSGLWSCCATCRGLLEAGGAGLVDQSVRIMVGRHGPIAAEPTRLLHQAFLDHFTGEITDRPPAL